MKIETKALYPGFKHGPATNAVAVPIYQTAAYAFSDTQHGVNLFDFKELGNIYSRMMNPTSDVLEQRVADREVRPGGHNLFLADNCRLTPIVVVDPVGPGATGSRHFFNSLQTNRDWEFCSQSRQAYRNT